MCQDSGASKAFSSVVVCQEFQVARILTCDKTVRR